MVMLSLTPVKDAVGTVLWPTHPTLDNYRTVINQDHFFLKNFWAQIANSFIVAIAVCALVLAIASLASFAVGRLRLWWGHHVSNAALLTYLIPAAFLAVPMYKTMYHYGMLDNQWALILSMVTFATPYAIWVLRQYAENIPFELDEAAKVDGATVPQIFLKVYLPLIVPALVAIGTYALLLSWNEYLYALLMLSTPTSVTLPVAVGYFLSSDDSPWALLMATSVIYALPPAALYYCVRRYMVSGLTAGAVKN
ncbi:MAG: carbohydrate ABC transporter permease [Proteobacteria bacterium]|nr:carbohydrate ABC transporter permease [Pseudomonadota bacterium]MBI3499313.1 carbohydrate ABC transporter permease [Pseudomonadota bacterium]